jgi:hypothetical protein
LYYIQLHHWQFLLPVFLSVVKNECRNGNNESQRPDLHPRFVDSERPPISNRTWRGRSTRAVMAGQFSDGSEKPKRTLPLLMLLYHAFWILTCTTRCRPIISQLIILTKNAGRFKVTALLRPTSYGTKTSDPEGMAWSGQSWLEDDCFASNRHRHLVPYAILGFRIREICQE